MVKVIKVIKVFVGFLIMFYIYLINVYNDMLLGIWNNFVIIKILEDYIWFFCL